MPESAQNPAKAQSLFRWFGRRSVELRSFYDPFWPNGRANIYEPYRARCPFCSCSDEGYVISEDFGCTESYGASCARCGFNWRETRTPGFGMEYCEFARFHHAVLLEFDLHDGAKGLQQINKRLRELGTDPYDFSEERFGDVVRGVFADLAYEMHSLRIVSPNCKQAILLRRREGRLILLERDVCSHTKTIRLSVPQMVLGIQLIKGDSRGTVFTHGGISVHASRDKIDEAFGSDYKMCLEDIDTLTRLMGVRNQVQSLGETWQKSELC